MAEARTKTPAKRAHAPSALDDANQRESEILRLMLKGNLTKTWVPFGPGSNNNHPANTASTAETQNTMQLLSAAGESKDD